MARNLNTFVCPCGDQTEIEHDYRDGFSYCPICGSVIEDEIIVEDDDILDTDWDNQGLDSHF